MWNLDIERVRSFVAQISGELISERTQQAQHQVGGDGQVEGGTIFYCQSNRVKRFTLFTITI